MLYMGEQAIVETRGLDAFEQFLRTLRQDVNEHEDILAVDKYLKKNVFW